MQNLDKTSLKILRSSLPKDGVNLIQDRLKQFTIEYINKVLRGVRNNEEIIAAAILIAKEEKSRIDALKNEIAQLASEELTICGCR